MEQRSRTEFRSLVEAVLSGTIFAHDQKQLDRWRRSADVKQTRALSPEGLEVAVASVAAATPEYIVVGR